MVARRELLQALAGLGLGSAVFQRALAAQMGAGGTITTEMVRQAEWIAGVEFTDEERQSALQAIATQAQKLDQLRAIPVDYATPPAVAFNPTPGELSTSPAAPSRRREVSLRQPPVPRPAHDDDLAFLPVARLAELLRSRQITSVELTELYLARLKRYDSLLHCVVTLTEDLARQQARRADEELAAGNDRGPLHGIPWGAKDLIAVPGYKTTWGATPFEHQTIYTKATVVERLEEAGAVLVAKLSLGALAWGDRWFGGQTRNPWNPEAGSSGSSAGSAAATAAGLVGFSLGSETLGSIISPCRVCGCAGLRPTYGRISRHGCMSLAWSMDKLGPICRTLEDCALVFEAIHGADGRDPSAVTRPFAWPSTRPLSSFRVGYFPAESGVEPAELARLRGLGVQLVPIRLPEPFPVGALTVILDAEATAVFDDLVRSERLAGTGLWPNSFRRGQLIPAVEYLRANRLRSELMRQMAALFQDLDGYVGGNDLTITNLTGHPTVILPTGVVEQNGKQLPATLTMTGRLYGEADLLQLAIAYEKALGFTGRPPLAAAPSPS